MYHVTVSGSYYEMGYQQGRLLQQGGLTMPPPEKKMLQFAHQCERVVGQYMPELLDEIQGVSDGSGIDYDALMTPLMTAPFDSDKIPGCSVVAIIPEKTRNKRIIVGRNYDMFEDISLEAATMYCTYPEGGYASVGNCDIWVGRWDGLNEAGLFTGSAALNMPGPLLPGPVGWFTGRHILDSYASVEEALTFIQELPRTGSEGRLIADKSGNAVVVEASVAGIEIRYPEDGVLVLTNHAVCPQFAGKETFVPESSRPRYNRLRELLRKELVTVRDVKNALSDHTGGVCAHQIDSTGRIMRTLWSMVGVPGERRADIAEGNPCQTAYRTVQF